MSDRAKILARIREALRLPAPRPGAHGGASLDQGVDAGAREKPDFSSWLPVVGKDFASRAELFARNSADLKTEFTVLESEAALAPHFQRLAEGNGWRTIGLHDGPLTRLAMDGSTLGVLRTDGGYRAEDLERCDAGLTECDALIAQTGTVLVTNRSAGGRALSVLPPHHVVVARAGQMLGDLPEAFALLEKRYGGDYPSMISLITGPSRTGDIERILVLGAHGPRKLTVLVVP